MNYTYAEFKAAFLEEALRKWGPALGEALATEEAEAALKAMTERYAGKEVRFPAIPELVAELSAEALAWTDQPDRPGTYLCRINTTETAQVAVDQAGRWWVRFPEALPDGMFKLSDVQERGARWKRAKAA